MEPNFAEKRSIYIKYYAFDEIFGLIGGHLELTTMIIGIFIFPYSELVFVADNSSKKEEMEL